MVNHLINQMWIFLTHLVPYTTAMAAPQIKNTIFITELSWFGILCVNTVTISYIYTLSISYLIACYPCCEGTTDADTEAIMLILFFQILPV